ncbi:hypothetical protein C7Y61_21265 [Xanthomonas vasicola pv. vasculorum]|nr:hypothetical protein C7Y61_21265 [Xanthomonas vasicola pv. vasculorum]
MPSAIRHPLIPIPDSRFPIPDSRFPIPDSRFPIPDSRFPIPDSQFPIPNSQFPIPNSQFPIPNSQFPIPNSAAAAKPPPARYPACPIFSAPPCPSTRICVTWNLASTPTWRGG